MIKLLYVTDHLGMGGAEKSLLEISKRLTHVEPVVCHIYPLEELKPGFEKAGIRVISLNTRGRYSFLSGVRSLLRIIDAEKPDVIHTMLFKAGVIARLAARIKNVPLVDSMINDAYSPIRWKSLSFGGKIKLGLVWVVDRVTAGMVFRFIAISKTVMAAQCRALSVTESKVRVIYRGRDPADYDVPPVPDLSPGKPMILNVARLLNRKGQRELIQAMIRVKEEVSGARLFIAGDGPNRKQVEDCIKSFDLQNDVDLLGTRQDVPQLLARADVFAFPSYYEGLGGALVEAMLAAKPIVATDTSVHRELIRHQETGLLAPLQDVSALADSLIWMLKNPQEAKQMGLRAQKEAVQKFHIDGVARDHDQFYSEVLSLWKVRKQ